MKGQAKALIPALIGIAILLLTGISGIFLQPGEQQATFTASQVADYDTGRGEILGPAFLRSSANRAAQQTYEDVAADMVTELKSAPSFVIANANRD